MTQGAVIDLCPFPGILKEGPAFAGQDSAPDDQKAIVDQVEKRIAPRRLRRQENVDPDMFALHQRVGADEDEVRTEYPLGVSVRPDRRLAESVARYDFETQNRDTHPDQEADTLPDEDIDPVYCMRNAADHTLVPCSARAMISSALLANRSASGAKSAASLEAALPLRARSAMPTKIAAKRKSAKAR
mmetsp:Transcript_11010/g.14434  ORF Transcript_11010/g.14434 Transcript_11010/m.14434 type:complete len:187 (-) Transcript_11010:3296-3856(-)